MQALDQLPADFVEACKRMAQFYGLTKFKCVFQIPQRNDELRIGQYVDSHSRLVFGLAEFVRLPQLERLVDGTVQLLERTNEKVGKLDFEIGVAIGVLIKINIQLAGAGRKTLCDHTMEI